MVCTFHTSHHLKLLTNNNSGTGQINSEPCVLIPETLSQYTFSVKQIYRKVFFCDGQDSKLKTFSLLLFLYKQIHS